MAAPKKTTTAAPKKVTTRPKKLLHFYDHDDQDARDLAYGAQKEACKKYEKQPVVYVDPSINGTWTPDED